MATRELTDAEVFGSGRRELTDAEVFGADDFLSDATPAAPSKLGRLNMGRGNALRPKRPQSVLEGIDLEPGVSAVFPQVLPIPAPTGDLGARLLGEVDAMRTPVQRAAIRHSDALARQAREQAELAQVREATDAAFGKSPVAQAIAAPARRLAAGAAQVVGGVASVPQLFGSDLGRETAQSAELMARANMPEDPGLADEVLAGAGQILPMVGGASAVRAALLPLLGDAAATGIATTLSGTAGGAMSGGEVLRDLEYRTDLSEDEKRTRAGLAALFSGLTGKYADRFLIPGADKAATGALAAGGRAFLAEGVQEGLDQAGQNLATDRPLQQGVGRAALVGGIVGGGSRAATEVGSDANLLAQAIEADANAFADAPAPVVVQQPVARAVGAPLPQPAPAPAPAAAPVPALPYDPSVGPNIMVAGADGAVRPMTADEFLEAEDARSQAQAKEMSDAEVGLTPDVRRAQEMRTEPGEAVVEPDLVQRLVAAGWKPPETTNASITQGAGAEPATATEADRGAAPDGTQAAAAARADGAAGENGLRADQPEPELTPPRAAAPETSRTSGPGRTASWVIRNKETGDVVMETFDRAKVDALNTAKYEAVPIQPYLASLNKDAAAGSLPPVEAAGQRERRATAGQTPEPVGDRPASAPAPELTEQFSRGTTPPVAARKDVAGTQEGERPAGDTDPGDYRGQHQAPGRADGAPAHDLNGNDVYPDDIYSPNGLRYYGTGSDLDSEAYNTLATLRGRPSRPVKIYRAVPHNESEVEELSRIERELARYQARRILPKGLGGRSGYEGESDWYDQTATRRDELRAKAEAGTIGRGKKLDINRGDWVTISRKYAQEHGEANLGGKFKIVSKTVKAGDIFTAGDSFLEWGYDPPTNEPAASDAADAQDSLADEGEQFRRGPEREPATSTAATIRTELRSRFGDVIDRLEKRGFLKLWDSVQAYNESGQFSQLPPEASGAAQGMYSHRTGIAHLFADGIEPGTAVAVMLHEVGEHASMKAMLGEQRYADLVKRAYALARGGDEVAEIAMMRIPDDTPRKFYDSEMVAYLIEEATNRQDTSPGLRRWLADAVAALRAWFYQTGFAKQLERYGVRIDLTPQDFAALAVRAVRWQAQQGGQEQRAGDAQPAFSKRQPLSATGSNPFAGQQFGPQPWTVAEPGTWDNIVRAMQDSKVDLKRVRAAIEERFGKIPDSADTYLQEELYHGKVAARVEKLHREAVEPILRKIAVAGEQHGVTLDDVNLYLHAKHAPERNAAMARINPNMPNNTALSGMSDADAAKALADFQRAGKAQALDTIAKDVYQLLADTRTALVADGLEEASTVQAWEQAYQNYVPLMRDVEDRPAKGQGVSVRGPEAKRAVGSNRQVVNILANVVTQAETAAIRAEKAQVGRSLLEMAQAYPNADFWKVDTPPVKPRVNPNTGLVERSAIDPTFQTADNVVMVKDYGAVRFIVFNKGNERAMAMAHAMKNLDVQQVPRAIRYFGAATRFMASLLTQRNPEFWLTNFARDLQGSMIQMSGTDAEGLQGKVLKSLPKAMAGMRHVARGTGARTQWARYAQELKDAGGTTGYMQQFENSNERMRDLQREVDRMQQGKADPRRLVRSMIDFIDDYNEVIENGMRLAVFQAAREAGISTERAASIAKNITVNFNRKGTATPIVNSLYMFFNAGLQGTARLAQALATSNRARVAVGTMAAVAFVMDVVNRAIAGDDEETKRNRYDLINEFEKSKNWIFMLPDGKYVKVPLPIGFNIFHNAGRLMSDAIFREDPRDAEEYGWAFASTVLDAFSPLGTFGSVGQLIAPSVLRPAVQLAENKNAFGTPVYKSDDKGFGKVDPKPAYTRHFDSTPDLWKAASKTLNDVTGGDKVQPGLIDIEPDVLRFVYGTLTGGPGRALDKTIDTTQAKARGEEVTPARIPFVHRFVGATDDRQRDAAYYQDLKRAEKAKTQFDYYTKNGRRDLALEVLKDLGQGDLRRGRQVIAEYERAKKDDRIINRRLRQLAEQKDDGRDVTEQVTKLKQQKRAGHKRVLSATDEPDEE